MLTSGSSCAATPPNSVLTTTHCKLTSRNIFISSNIDLCYVRRKSISKQQPTAAVLQPTSSSSSNGGSASSRCQVPLYKQQQRIWKPQERWRCRQGTNDASTTNGASGAGGQQNGNGNGSNIVDPEGNGGDGSNGSSGGSNRPNSRITSSSDHGDGGSNNLPATREQLVVAAVLGFIAVIAAGALKWSTDAHQMASDALAAVTPEGKDNSISSLDTRESINALKRLLREVFQENLGLKSRLDTLEKAEGEELEAADDYHLQVSAAGSSSSWTRAPVRMSGWFSAVGVLPWTQEVAGSDTAVMLARLGAHGQTDARLALHSVLARGKRRITAELQHVQQDSGQPSLQLARLLYRVQVKKWLQLMIAPLGGSLDAIARSVTPQLAEYGCTQALRNGHGLSAFDHVGSGKAAAISKGCLSAAAGFFVGGTSKTSLLQLQLKGREGHSISLVGAKHRRRAGSAAGEAASSSNSRPGFRFLGVQTPGSSGNCSSDSSSEGARTVLGAVGVLPVGKSLTATAWAEKPSTGQAGWGLGLYSDPDPQGFEAGMVLGRLSSQHAAFRAGQVPLFCEVTAKVPVGDGLSISPGAMVTVREGKGTLAYLMHSSWRF